jgi:SAM-dependent methyltransferase
MAERAALYDRIGLTYSTSRTADPRLSAAIHGALGDARSVVNVGAGTGDYEPFGLDVIAIEPSEVMIAQRPAGSAQAIRGVAEALPLEDASVDAAMAIFSDHHWTDRTAGLREMRRVARKRIVLLNSDPSVANGFWLTRDYLPGFLDLIPEDCRAPGYWRQELRRLLGDIRVHVIPVPHDCTDGFYQAYWRRPSMYLRADVRRNISVFHRLPATDVSRAVQRLSHDLDNGTWHKRHDDLTSRPELDVGLRLVVAELG